MIKSAKFISYVNDSIELEVHKYNVGYVIFPNFSDIYLSYSDYCMMSWCEDTGGGNAQWWSREV